MTAIETAVGVLGLLGAGGAVFFGAVRAWAAVLPLHQARRDRLALEASLERGAFSSDEIARATYYYVRPKCSNVDASQETELRLALSATREDLFRKLDHFLYGQDVKRHLLILADSGTGKTSCLLNYFARNRRRPRSKRRPIHLIPLGAPDADDRLEALSLGEDSIVFLDAFDEDPRALEDHRRRLEQIMRFCSAAGRVVMTCRTQFFLRDEEIPRETGIARVGVRPLGKGPTYEFWKYYLAPFDDADVESYLRKRFPWPFSRRRRQARDLVKKIPNLTARPMLLAHLPDLLESDRAATDAYGLYSVMVERWLVREGEKAGGDLDRFSERLAIDLFEVRGSGAVPRYPRDRLSELAKSWDIDLPDWRLGGRSLLNRDAEGFFKFAHRSIGEFLVARALCDQRIEVNTRLRLSDQIAEFVEQRTGFLLPAWTDAGEALGVEVVSRRAWLLNQVIHNSRTSWRADPHNALRELEAGEEGRVLLSLGEGLTSSASRSSSSTLRKAQATVLGVVFEGRYWELLWHPNDEGKIIFVLKPVSSLKRRPRSLLRDLDLNVPDVRRLLVGGLRHTETSPDDFVSPFYRGSRARSLPWPGPSESGPRGCRRRPLDSEVELVEIPGWLFVMGDRRIARASPEHRVTVRAFSISKYPVTNAQYLRYVDECGDARPPHHWDLGRPPMKKMYHPVTRVSWDDAKRFCAWLQTLLRRERSDDELIVGLPTEAQWEYAARGGESQRTYPWGEASPSPDLANFGGGGTTPVDRFRRGATPEGVWDMAGNVWEWMEDEWHSDYVGAPNDGTAWVKKTSSGDRGRALRGGSFLDPPSALGSAYRTSFGPHVNDRFVGFRVVLLPSRV